jgi:hypothetical protein
VAFELQHIKETGLGCCLAKVECQGRARGHMFSRSSGSRLCPRLDDLLDLESARFGRDRGLGQGSGLGRGRSLPRC